MDIRVVVRGHADKSDLRTHAEERLTSAVERFTDRIRHVSVQLADESGPNHHGGDQRCKIDVQLKPSGEILIDEVGDDIHASIALAVDRLKSALSRETGKQKRGVGGG